MIRLKTFRPSLVILAFPETIGDPADINMGQCMQWAYMAYCMFEDVELWSASVHAFIKHGNKFYDSERLRGVRSWKSLPACNSGIGCGCASCRSLHSQAYQYTAKDFKRRWDGPYERYNWRKYQRLAQSFVRERVES